METRGSLWLPWHCWGTPLRVQCWLVPGSSREGAADKLQVTCSDPKFQTASFFLYQFPTFLTEGNTFSIFCKSEDINATQNRKAKSWNEGRKCPQTPTEIVIMKKKNRTLTPLVSRHQEMGSFQHRQAAVLCNVPDFVWGGSSWFMSSPPCASALHGMQVTPAHRLPCPGLLFLS